MARRISTSAATGAVAAAFVLFGLLAPLTGAGYVGGLWAFAASLAFVKLRQMALWKEKNDDHAKD